MAGNITGGLLTGQPGRSRRPISGRSQPGTGTGDFTVTAAKAGVLSNQAVHVANNFRQCFARQTMSITGQINNYAALALLKEGRERPRLSDKLRPRTSAPRL